MLWVKGKGAKLRKVKLQVPVLRAIEQYFHKSGRQRNEEAPLFVVTQQNRGEIPISTNTIAQIVKKRAKEAGITKRITTHSLRQTAITLTLDGGASVRQVEQLAGHADPKPPCGMTAIERTWMIIGVTISRSRRWVDGRV